MLCEDLVFILYSVRHAKSKDFITRLVYVFPHAPGAIEGPKGPMYVED